MATYAQNLEAVQLLQQCGTGYVAIIPDPSVDVIEVKDQTPDDQCGTTLVWKPFHGLAGIDLSGEPDSGVA